MMFSRTTPAVLASIFIGFTLSAGALACSTDGWDFASPTIEVGSPFGATPPDVNGVSRFEELCALKADLQAEHVGTDSPSHGRVRARVYMYPDLSALRGVPGAATVMTAFSADAGGGSELFRVSYDTGSWIIDAGANGGGSDSVAATGGWDSLELDWDPAMNELRVWFNTDATSVGADLILASGTTQTTMESLQLGLPEGPGDYDGAVYFDSVELRNQTAIGLVVNCDANLDMAFNVLDLLEAVNEINEVSLAAGTPDCNFSGGTINVLDLLAMVNVINAQ